MSCAGKLLIVPCGIETELIVFTRWHEDLLIVPCGIETSIRGTNKVAIFQLLIVPCGIETLASLFVLVRSICF